MFSAGDSARLHHCLTRLLRHLRVDDFAVTGGVAVEMHLAAAGRPGIRSTLGDLDAIARDVDALPPTLTGDFLVSHRHVAGPGVPKSLLQLVDPVTRLRVDCFPDVGGDVAAATRMTFGRSEVRVATAATLLQHKTRTIRKASANDPVDPKHVRDAVALARLCGLPAPSVPLYIAPATYGTDVEATCSRCERTRSDAFPLAPKRAILALLGYV